MSKVKFINKSKHPKCWVCDAKGKIKEKKCSACKGTGKFKEDFYHLIYTDEKGQKLCFGVDGIK